MMYLPAKVHTVYRKSFVHVVKCSIAIIPRLGDAGDEGGLTALALHMQHGLRTRLELAVLVGTTFTRIFQHNIIIASNVTKNSIRALRICRYT